MSNLITVTRTGSIAVATIDNPPVNALGFDLRQALVGALSQLRDDSSCKAIVIACAGRTFISGADISEFGTPKQMMKPILPDLIALIDSIEKPTVAAIHGNALGGGLELALSCHYRVADRGARLGLPEVKIGIIPGSGGTVRLPRVTGAVKALEMIVTGDPVSAEEAHAVGLVDALADGAHVGAAVKFAEERLAEGARPLPVRERNEKIAETDMRAFEAIAETLKGKARGLQAPIVAVQSVRDTIELPFDEAMRRAREAALALMSGTESRAMRHVFFAEREAAKLPGMENVTPRPIEKIGVIGAGTMGGGIAMAFANAAFPVTIFEISDEALNRGLSTIRKNYAASVARGSLGEDEKTSRLSRIVGSTDFGDLGDCDLIIEAVFEDIDIKRELFERLKGVAKPGAILATNTSYLDVDAIAAASGRASDVVGLHFFSPANVMKLLEIVRGAKTAPDVLATALAAARRIGKSPVVVGVCHGFVGNRMLAAQREEAEALLLDGATPQQVDKAFTAFGWPMGPFQMSDLAGLDIGWRNRKAQGKKAIIADWLCEQDRFGQKTGRGFYLYEGGSRKGIPDPEVLDFIESKRAELGITRREVSEKEIVERTVYPMINEGAKILEEGIAARASDIDVVWIRGYGFPLSKGGPMFWAGLQTLSEIVGRLRHWHERTGKAVYEPAGLLLEKAAAGETF
ncbi:3-hydroxyacyl-CoA dehydrogenase NAD-binding domain-containing protein [Aquamicrobium sp. LC103]|uniref:3-hydroxyacyl-CoA dehydrogenase NAD-binding domain-containing protein n=1 Tax=Aquamicrobium sp. LC103 TaxID=1120658 RepID=UPI00063E70B8|nr:3-hydroxyacyl-CoA dehydrogenase NAD-binding domain-containing protein [Aquamicrobium sp. LC103]TKT69641.1 3-hydroxyacyl-CoA dehydrogenase [Aquamicrobium sp. LC103]